MKEREFLKWMWRGKSARRALLNVELAHCEKIRGSTLDVGGKGWPSYRGTLAIEGGACWTVMDIFAGEGVSLCGDVRAMPFRDEAFDNVVCFNVLEHVDEYPKALTEIRRVLKVNGLLYGYVPFLCNVHSDPVDYWRFTGACLEKTLRQSGFTCNAVNAQGGVFIACFDLVSFVIRKVRPVYVLFAVAALVADKWVDRVRPSYRARFPVGYFFVGLKASVGPEDACAMV